MPIDRTKAPELHPIQKFSYIYPNKLGVAANYEYWGLHSDKNPIVKLEIVFPTGKRNASTSLVAILASKLFGKQTSSHSSDEIAEIIDNYGLIISATVENDFTHIKLFSVTKFTDAAFDLLEEMLLETQYGGKEFDNEVERQKTSFLINSEKTDFIAIREFYRNVYPDGYVKMMEHSDFETIEVKQVQNFFNEWFFTTPMTIVLSGDYSSEHVKRINKMLSRLPFKKNKSTIKQPLFTKNKSYKCFEKNNAEQSSIVAGNITISKTHKDFKKLMIVNTILGGYFGSRLSKNIREDKGYTYGVYSSLISYINHSLFKIRADVGNEFVVDYQKEVEKEILRLHNELVSKEELDLVKNYLRGSLLSLFDGVFEQASVFASMRSFGLDFLYYDEFLKELNGVAQEEIMNIARKYLNVENMLTVVAGKC